MWIDVQIIKGNGAETGGNIFVEKTLSWEIESKEAREWENYFGIKLLGQFLFLCVRSV